jgi:hypothetical protein
MASSYVRRPFLLVRSATGFAHAQQDMPESDWSLVAVSMQTASIHWLFLIAP